jgi:hypothetical protein|tara:strand:+ start:912 stop:1454 length:543 start_codon:yes stop_codon:yes gene_type:complete
MDYELYDWDSLIDANSRQRMVETVDEIIASGNYFTNSPRFQTKQNVFGLPTSDWINLKMSFIWSCFAFMNREVQIKNIQSWSFQTSLKTAENRDILWHHHNHNSETTTVSGVYYLRIPNDVDDLDTAGTELAPNGVEGEGKYITPFKTGHWMIYPGKIWHRPGILQSEKNRYIVAADLEF